MKITIFSDSHGRMDALERVMRRLYATTDVFVHVGDGAAELFSLSTEFPDRMYVAVRGNCDGFSAFSIKKEETLDLDGCRIFITHGDRYGVKGSLDSLRAAALSRDADVAIFGHTHQKYCEYSRVGPTERTKFASQNASGRCPEAIYLFNPGSIGLPRGDRPSWGVLEIKNGATLLSHGEL